LHAFGVDYIATLVQEFRVATFEILMPLTAKGRLICELSLANATS
jgi:hypothetical protein